MVNAHNKSLVPQIDHASDFILVVPFIVLVVGVSTGTKRKQHIYFRVELRGTQNVNGINGMVKNCHKAIKGKNLLRLIPGIHERIELVAGRGRFVNFSNRCS
jgi:hypothetical protein